MPNSFAQGNAGSQAAMMRPALKTWTHSLSGSKL